MVHNNTYVYIIKYYTVVAQVVGLLVLHDKRHEEVFRSANQRGQFFLKTDLRRPNYENDRKLQPPSVHRICSGCDERWSAVLERARGSRKKWKVLPGRKRVVVIIWKYILLVDVDVFRCSKVSSKKWPRNYAMVNRCRSSVLPMAGDNERINISSRMRATMGKCYRIIVCMASVFLRYWIVNFSSYNFHSEFTRFIPVIRLRPLNIYYYRMSRNLNGSKTCSRLSTKCLFGMSQVRYCKSECTYLFGCHSF